MSAFVIHYQRGVSILAFQSAVERSNRTLCGDQRARILVRKNSLGFGSLSKLCNSRNPTVFGGRRVETSSCLTLRAVPPYARTATKNGPEFNRLREVNVISAKYALYRLFLPSAGASESSESPVSLMLVYNQGAQNMPYKLLRRAKPEQVSREAENPLDHLRPAVLITSMILSVAVTTFRPMLARED